MQRFLALVLADGDMKRGSCVRSMGMQLSRIGDDLFAAYEMERGNLELEAGHYIMLVNLMIFSAFLLAVSFG